MDLSSRTEQPRPDPRPLRFLPLAAGVVVLGALASYLDLVMVSNAWLECRKGLGAPDQFALSLLFVTRAALMPVIVGVCVGTGLWFRSRVLRRSPVRGRPRSVRLLLSLAVLALALAGPATMIVFDQATEASLPAAACIEYA
jgi:hypothetical protein